MKTFGLFIVLLTSNTFAEAPQHAANCPLDRGELPDFPCDKEQRIVKRTLRGLTKAEHFTYCLKAKPGSDGEGIQCRGPVLYKNRRGEIDLRLFEDRFVASELDRDVFFRIYFVRMPNGLYNAYSDTTTDGKLNIDLHLEGASQNIAVSFDSKNRPSFTTKFINAGTNPPTTILSTLEHFGTHADLTNDITGQEKDTRRYFSLNPVQVVTEE